MRALQCDEFSVRPKLSMREMRALQPSGGEVLIEVASAGLGHVDALVCSGRYQVRPPLPFTPGAEAAGRVLAVGEGVRSVAPGDRVAALVSTGALAEQALAREDLVLKLPQAVSLRTAAASLVNYSTALYGLADLGGAAAGETVLVLGAGGGLGLAAIDVARSLGLRAIGLASSEAKRAAAAAQGAALTFDYGQPDWRRSLERELGKASVDMVFDPVGGGATETAFRLLRAGGRHLVVGFASGEIPTLPMNLPLLKRSAVIGVDWGGAVRADPALFRPLFASVAAALASGAMSPAALTPTPLAGAAEALADLPGRRGRGKLIVDINPETER